MATDQDEPSDAERLLDAQRYQREFEQRRIADPNLARMPGMAPHRPWRATLYDRVMTGLGVVILIGLAVMYLFF